MLHFKDVGNSRNQNETSTFFNLGNADRLKIRIGFIQIMILSLFQKKHIKPNKKLGSK
jgi:hypothetical protein